MKLALSFLSILSLAAVSACKREDSALAEKLDKISQQQDAILTALKSQPRGGAGARGAAGDRPQRPRPKPEVTYSIPVDKSPIRGPKEALVTIVEGFEFACPYCEQSRGVVDQMLETYPKDVRVAYKHYVVHPGVATTPALAACAAHKQGKYAAMEPLIWDKGYKAGRNLGAENMEKLAAEAGLDVARFKADMNGEECKTYVREDQTQLGAVGVSGTPAFYVNGRHVQQRSPEGFKALIDEELKKAKERVAQGTKPADYYKQWVVDKGEKKL